MTNLSKNWNILSDMYICIYIYIEFTFLYKRNDKVKISK